MPLDSLLIMVLVAVLGFYAGKFVSAKKVRPGSEYRRERVSAYEDLFDALTVAEVALLNAGNGQFLDGHLSEEMKKTVWESLNSVVRVFERVRFLLPQDAIDVLESFDVSKLRMSWGERLEEVRRVKNLLLILARKDVGAD